ncbi:hypothetical protein [Legionella parisiensis]|uniref:Lysine-specific metallo-endopeptidase domain-containing protein n=1 Tax=Legionella parisiensis TaxID=45071 RepID=A0A1E5JTG3_9GAMM|nr:hypothetical protein [Legionella parisiensis]KTD40403.1 hypothetical protein Lpar_1720 [Legionella parisiensis]OEH47812.1 hypothetical protein lpari_01190 [Legionella parisiensis]STX77163.1 Uncharacterised protein [Legionella parisiensis]
MPKDPKKSKKKPEYITQDRTVVSLKSRDGTLTKQEKETLNQIYNESVIRLERTLYLLTQLQDYLNSYDQGIKNQRNINIKQMLIDDEAPAEVLHALKMLKRHFYISITGGNSIGTILDNIESIKNNLLKTYKGLNRQLNISLEIMDHKPLRHEIGAFAEKTYALVRANDQWSLFYYENKDNNPVELNINGVIPQINTQSTVNGAKLNYHLLLRGLMLYHAKNVESQPNKVYISNIRRSLINNPNNTVVGYVFGHEIKNDNGEVVCVRDYFGAIHIDYRMLTDNPSKALGTLLHESSHRYGFVNDRGYYHGRKAIKNSTEERPYPEDFRALPRTTPSECCKVTSRAINNADTYSFFVLDNTDSHELYDRNNLPDWYDTDKEITLPVEKKSYTSSLIKYSLFAAGCFLLGGIVYAKRDSIMSVMKDTIETFEDLNSLTTNNS